MGSGVLDVTKLRTVASPAERLRWLEYQDERLSKELHRLTRRRAEYKDEALRLRVSLTSQERALYEALRGIRR